MNGRILTTRKRLSALLIILLCVTLLPIGCTRSPQAVLSRVWRTDKAADKLAASDANRADETETADSETDASSGNMWTAWLRKGGSADSSKEDPFLNQFEQVDFTEDRAQQPPKLPAPGSGEMVDAGEPDESINPFAEFQREPPVDENPRAVPEHNPFADGFDSQLERLQAALEDDLQQANSPESEWPVPADVQPRVESLMEQARKEMEGGRLDDAYRTALSAEELAVSSGVLLGPDREEPGDLVRLLQDRLSKNESGEPDHPTEESLAGWPDFAVADTHEPRNARGVINDDMIVESEALPPQFSSQAMTPAEAIVGESFPSEAPPASPPESDSQNPGDEWWNSGQEAPPASVVNQQIASPAPPSSSSKVRRASANQGAVVTAAALSEGLGPRLSADEAGEKPEVPPSYDAPATETPAEASHMSRTLKQPESGVEPKPATQPEPRDRSLASDETEWAEGSPKNVKWPETVEPETAGGTTAPRWPMVVIFGLALGWGVGLGLGHRRRGQARRWK